MHVNKKQRKEIPYLSFSGGNIRKYKRVKSKLIKVRKGKKGRKVQSKKKIQKGGFIGGLLASIGLPIISEIIKKL